jgi:hypothetical protein
LRASLALLAAESPLHLRAMQAALRNRQVRISLDEEPPTRLVVDPSGLHVVGEGDPAQVDVSLASHDLLRVLAGEQTLEEAIVAGQVTVRGTCDDVLAFDDGLRAWLHGAVRSPSFSTLLERLQTHYAGKRRHSSS